MRLPLPFIFLLATVAAATAQVQERKLMDRIMKPDMTLGVHDQNKHFEGTSSAPANKTATMATFQFHENPLAKAFRGDRTFSARGYSAKRFGGSDTAANLAGSKVIPKAHQYYETFAATAIRDAPGSTKTAVVREYAETKPFLVQGKSQEDLHKRDHPLTIDEVRDLLNKN